MKKKITHGVLLAALGLAAGGFVALKLVDQDFFFQPAWAITPAGVQIQNQATATYLDASSNLQTTSSNLVQTLVQEVVGIDLVQGQTKTVGINTTVNYAHFLTNTGNGPESYTVCIDQSAFQGGGTPNEFDFNNVALYEDTDLDGIGDVLLTTTTEPVNSITAAELLTDPSPSEGCYAITTLAGGSSIQLVVQSDIPATGTGGALTGGEQAKYQISAWAETEPENNNDTDDVDTAIITVEPTIEVIKAISANTGVSPSGPYTVTLTYRNTSLVDAQNLEIVEVLPLNPEAPSSNTGGMTYVTSTSSWVHLDNTDSQIDSIAALTDDDELAQQGTGFGTTGINVTFCSYDVSCSTSPFASDRMVIQVSSIPAGEEGTLSFDINIDSGLDDSDVLINSVTYQYENLSGTTIDDGGSPFDSNAVTFTIQNTVTAPALVANDTDATGGELLGVDDSDDTNNIVYEENTYNGSDPATSRMEQGGQAIFYNYIWNTGNGEDTFDLSVDNVNDREGNPLAVPFPPGTTFTLFKADGITPFLDTNSNSTTDTGPLNPGESILVVLVVEPPATLFGDNSGFGWDVTLVAASGADENITNAVTDHLSEITQSFIDLTNDGTYNGDCVDPADNEAFDPLPPTCQGTDYQGEGLGPEAAGVNTIDLTIGGTTFFPLWAFNIDPGNGGATDSYNLDFSTTIFDAGVAPAGWTIEFLESGNGTDCSAVGSVITNTGVLLPGSNIIACVGITLDTDLVADGQPIDIYFRAQSPTSNVADIKLDSFMLLENPAIAIIPDASGQGSPGGFVVYPHEIQNSGNTNLECVNVAVVDDLVADGWTSQVILDVNGDGLEDAGDVPYTEQFDSTTPFAPGQQMNVLVKIFVPATAASGTVNTSVVTVTANQDDLDLAADTCTGTAVTDFSTDVTTVNVSDIVIIKSQALDADCDGAEDVADSFVTTSFEVDPMQCVRYRLQTTNTGTERMVNLVINDLTPAFTIYIKAAEECVVNDGTATTCEATPWPNAPADGGTGIVSVTIPSLESGGDITLNFGIQVE